MSHRSRLPRLLGAVALLSIPLALGAIGSTLEADAKPIRSFQRIANFGAYLNTSAAEESVAEIVAASTDGKTLVYSDGASENIGFVDISDPYEPEAAGVVGLGGEPTSVAVVGKWVLAAVNTSPDLDNPSGELVIIDLKSRDIIDTVDLEGQPDAIAVSPDGNHAAIAIENERDEDEGDGRPPQAPAGFVWMITCKGKPSNWSFDKVELTGIADKFPTDPEPEYVDINKKNQCVVTLQENNHIVLIDCKTAQVIHDFSAGTADLSDVDTLENDLIQQTASLFDVPREPDAVAWISDDCFATADEGDLDGGSRGFTLFDTDGSVAYMAGNTIEHLTARIGHYPEARSENKGSEPEGVEYAKFGKDRYLFVGSERSSVIVVYKLFGKNPVFQQVLPTGTGPEGIVAIPQRGLLVVASEEDDAGAFRSGITIYKLKNGAPAYPTIESDDRSDGTPIAWAALSALAANPNDADIAYTIHDSFYAETRFYTMDLSQWPARIVSETVLDDGGSTLHLDGEGLSRGANGELWIASEGAGSVDDPTRPVESLNLLVRVASDGEVLEKIELDEVTNDKQRRFGLEGCAYVDDGSNPYVYVAFQREWVGDTDDHVRIGRYDTNSGDWTYFYYPIEEPVNGGWVGLSEIIALDDTCFAVVERDNQGGPDAAIKRIYAFSVAGLTPLADAEATPSFPVVSKLLVRDLLADLKAPGGQVIEKVEGLMRAANGDAYIHTDNDGVDDSSGETQLINLGAIFDGVCDLLEGE